MGLRGIVTTHEFDVGNIGLYTLHLIFLIMKEHVKKVLASVAITIAFLLPISALAQEKHETSVKPAGYLSVGVGAYAGLMPLSRYREQSMQDIYGTIPRFRVSFAANVSKTKRLETRLEWALAYMSKEVQPDTYVYEDVSVKMQTLQVEGLIKEVFPGKNTRFYLGLGFAYIDLTEELTAGSNAKSIYPDFNESGLGWLILLGLETRLNKEKTINLYTEASWRFVTIKNDWGEEIEMGGGVLETGILFLTK